MTNPLATIIGALAVETAELRAIEQEAEAAARHARQVREHIESIRDELVAAYMEDQGLVEKAAAADTAIQSIENAPKDDRCHDADQPL